MYVEFLIPSAEGNEAVNVLALGDKRIESYSSRIGIIYILKTDRVGKFFPLDGNKNYRPGSDRMVSKSSFKLYVKTG